MSVRIMYNAGLPLDLRLLLVHKQKTSARVRFLRLPHGMCAFTPLPAAAVLDEAPPSDKVDLHPRAGLADAARCLGLAVGALAPEQEFAASLRTAEGTITVHLARFDTEDPPFASAAALGGRFVAITEARDVGAVELELLRRAYTTLMG